MIRKQRQNRMARSAGRPNGFTLIELMVAMLLGLVVIGGVTSVFLAGQQTYRTNEALSDVEQGSRTAFELLARDIRDAGNTGCDTSSGRVANVVNPPDPWYADWNDALVGYDDATTDPALAGITGNGAPVAKTSSVHVLSTANSDVTISQVPSKDSASFEINAATTQLTTGELIMICDFDHATILQITNYNGATNVVHDSGNNATPGNCSKGLGYPTICTGPATGNAYLFPPNSRVAVLTAEVWYIGTNPLNGQSLYRLDATSGAGGVTATPQEMVRNVTNMQIAYLQPPGATFSTASNVTNWAVVDAAQVTLTLLSTSQRVGATSSAPLQRSFTSTTTVRTRVQ
ncbi:prepilin-type N-terminal cleavage/methylation domain-containing protein [Dyella psychrodurans]|nr:prepilin-type N-terminal cleavage/methylation domain-containing protein [Dyella psychrodurans]